MLMLDARLVPVPEISLRQKKRMFDLMDAHFGNMRLENFHRDLEEKQWVLLLEGEGNGLVGFSTQKFFTHLFQGREIGVVFSGDTIIDKAHRGSPVLAWAFGRFMRDLERRNPGLPLYWMLISHSLATYRYLPLYFRDFFPRFDMTTPPDFADLMHSLGTRFFSHRYDPAQGIVIAPPGGPFLRSSDAPDRAFFRNQPDCRFFFERNPGHRRGDELLCLARFGEPHARPAAWRYVDKMPPIFPDSQLQKRC